MRKLPRLELEKLYIHEGKSIRWIATEFHMGERTVSQQLKDHGIKVISGGWSKPIGGRTPLTPELLHELRYEQLLTREQIADKYGYTFGEIRVAIRKYGIKNNDYHNSSINKLGAGELWHLHVDQRQSMTVLAKRFGASTENVKRRMDELGIPVVSKLANHTQMPKRPKRIGTPDLKLINNLENEADGRIRIPRERIIDSISKEELRRLHHDEKLALWEIAAQYQTASKFISERMREFGLEIRHRRTSRGSSISSKDLERLKPLYERSDVTKVLKRHGIPNRDDPSFEFVIDLEEPLIRSLYVDCELPAQTIGFLCGRTAVAVRSSLRRFGIEPRPRKLPRAKAGQKVASKVTAKYLQSLLDKGLSVEAIATKCGYSSVTSLYIAARALQVDLSSASPSALPREVKKAITDSGVSANHARRVLDPHYLGQGSFSDLPTWPWPPSPVLLNYMFHDLGFSKTEIMARLRFSHEAGEEAIRDAGIESRRYEPPRPFGRWQFDKREMRKFVKDDLTSSQIAEHLGVSGQVVSTWLHRHHMPVLRNNSERRVRFEDLVADSRVITALRRANVPLAGIDPPNSGPLPPSLVVRLVKDLGLKPFDVELLTGRRAAAVRTDMRKAGLI